MKRSDLTNGDYEYSWEAVNGDNPRITGKPDRGKLNRSEGYEVLDFINFFARKHGITDKEMGFKIEDLIHINKDAQKETVIAWLEAQLALF